MTGLTSAIQEPVLVTGASGFIGQHLLRRLADASISTVGFDLPSAIFPNHLRGKVRWVSGDITNTGDVKAACCGIGTIFHLAAMVGDWGSYRQHQKVTVEGSRLLFEEALKQNSRLILTSSIVVYGDRLARQLCTEQTPFGKHQGPYSKAKQAQEQLAWEYYQNHQLPLTVVRPANVYGPGSVPWFHAVIEELRRGTPCLINGGDFDAGLVYVENLIDVLLLVASQPRTIGAVYNACGHENTVAR